MDITKAELVSKERHYILDVPHEEIPDSNSLSGKDVQILFENKYKKIARSVEWREDFWRIHFFM
jgi:hypothetical protein